MYLATKEPVSKPTSPFSNAIYMKLFFVVGVVILLITMLVAMKN